MKSTAHGKSIIPDTTCNVNKFKHLLREPSILVNTRELYCNLEIREHLVCMNYCELSRLQCSRCSEIPGKIRPRGNGAGTCRDRSARHRTAGAPAIVPSMIQMRSPSMLSREMPNFGAQRRTNYRPPINANRKPSQYQFTGIAPTYGTVSS